MITLPKTLTLQQAQDLRTQAEKGTDPNLYRAAAAAFRILHMDAAAGAMQQRADHYQRNIGSTVVPATF